MDCDTLKRTIEQIITVSNRGGFNDGHASGLDEGYETGLDDQHAGRFAEIQPNADTTGKFGGVL